MFIVVAKKCCTEPRPVQCLREELVWGPKELGGNGIRTADLNWPNRYSIAYDFTQKESFEGVGVRLALLHCFGS